MGRMADVDSMRELQQQLQQRVAEMAGEIAQTQEQVAETEARVAAGEEQMLGPAASGDEHRSRAQQTRRAAAEHERSRQGRYDEPLSS